MPPAYSPNGLWIRVLTVIWLPCALNKIRSTFFAEYLEKSAIAAQAGMSRTGYKTRAATFSV